MGEMLASPRVSMRKFLFSCWILRSKILCSHPVSGLLPSLRSGSLPVHLTWQKRGKEQVRKGDAGKEELREMLARNNSGRCWQEGTRGDAGKEQLREMLARRNSPSPLNCVLLTLGCHGELTRSKWASVQVLQKHEDLLWVSTLHSEFQLVSDLLLKIPQL